MEENTLHFSITIDGDGLKDIESKANAAFKGIGKAVSELSSKSVNELDSISLELMEVVDRFNDLAKAVGINPSELRQTLNFLREMREEQEKLEKAALTRMERLQNAEAKIIRSQIANLEAERRAKEKNQNDEFAAQQKLARIQQENISKISKMRSDSYAKFISEINAQNAKIKESGDKAVAAFEKALGIKEKSQSFKSGFASGAGNVFGGSNNGTFSNILGGFGGGGRIGGTLASSLDGALSGGGGFAGTLGGLAAGAGIGAAIAAVTALISVLKAAASAFLDFTKSSIKAAADLEQTTNSIAVFSGGVHSARKELSLLESVVENTPGLSLEGAEAGYKQLRALGFEAANSRKLIEGLGKIQITSGATEQSVERVIVNLTQLSASTARAGQDIKEIIHALPAIRPILREAFGSADAKAFKSAIERDGAAAFDKLAEAMANAKSAAPGLNTELTALGNQWTIAQREFGREFISGAIELIRNLTGWLKANKTEFRVWGAFIGGAISGVIRWVTALKTHIETFYPTLYKFLKAASLVGLADTFVDRNQIEAQGSVNDAAAAEEERLQAIEDARTKAEIAEEKRRAKQLQAIQDTYKLRAQIIENAFKVEEARVNANSTYTIADEIEKAKRLGEIRRNSIKAQLAFETSSLNEQIALTGEGDEKSAELRTKRDELINKFNTELKINEINTAKEIREGEEKQLEQRRTNALEFKQFQLDQAKFGLDVIANEIKRGLDKQVIDTKEGYRVLKVETNAYYDAVRELTRERYALQLQDKRLSEEQRNQITLRMNQEELVLANDQKNALLKISDDRLAAEESRRQKSLERMKSYYSAVGSIFSDLASSLFSPENFGGKNLETFGKLFLETDRKAEIRGNIKTRTDAANSLIANPGSYSKEEIAKRLADNQTILGGYTEQLNKVEKDIPATYKEIDALGQSILKGIGNFREFDEIAKKALKGQHDSERNALQADIDNLNRRKEIARNEYIAAQRSSQTYLKIEADKLEQAKKDGKKLGTFEESALIGYKSQIADIDAIIYKSSSKDWFPETEKVEELNGEIKQTGIALKGLGMRQRTAEAERYANSIEGLTERFEKLNSGDIGTINALLDGISKDVLRERAELLEENIELETRIAIIGDDSAARYRNAWLRAIYDVKSASEEARESQIESQVRIADQTEFNADRARAGILEAMAGAKGYTEIFQDGFLKVNDAISDGLTSLIGKATENLGAFGDVITDIAGQLLKMVTNRLMMKLLDALLPSTFGGSGGGGISGVNGGGLGLGGILKTGLGILTGGGFGGGGGNAGLAGGGTANGFASNAIAEAFKKIGGADAVGSTLTSGDTFSGGIQTLGGLTYESSGKAVDMTGLGGLNGAFGGAGILKGLGAAAPLLGLGLGAGLGGQSIGGQLLGGLGGLAGGLALGIGTGAIGATGGVIGGLVGALGGAAAATGILAAVAVPLLVGGYLLSRNKQRREDEKLRTVQITEALSNMDKILADVRAHKFSSGEEAVTAAQSVISQYRDNVSQLKSDKTRRIALKEINDRLNPKLEEIRAAAAIADEDKRRFEDRIPEFATGGIVPGRFGEPRLVLAHGGEIIANASQQTPALVQAASDAGVPGVRGGSGGSGGNRSPQNLKVELLLGTEAQNQLFVNGAKSSAGYKVSIEQTKKARDYRDVSF